MVSGNVSFYNGTNKKNIYPTPVIGGIGLINDLKKITNLKTKENGNLIIIVGKTIGHLGQSTFLYENFSIKDGPPPEINLLNEKSEDAIT